YDETARDLAAKRGTTAVARLLGATPADPAEDAGQPARKMKTIPVAVERALALTEKQSYEFIRVAGCNSCHSQDLPSAAAGFARSEMARPLQSGDDAGSRVSSPRARVGWGKARAGSRARAPGNATRGWRLEPVARDGVRCLPGRAGAVCADHGRRPPEHGARG